MNVITHLHASHVQLSIVFDVPSLVLSILERKRTVRNPRRSIIRNVNRNNKTLLLEIACYFGTVHIEIISWILKPIDNCTLCNLHTQWTILHFNSRFQYVNLLKCQASKWSYNWAIPLRKLKRWKPLLFESMQFFPEINNKMKLTWYSAFELVVDLHRLVQCCFVIRLKICSFGEIVILCFLSIFIVRLGNGFCV